MMAEYRRFIVSGRVQGVFYRVSAQRQATALGLDGWVRNLPDGSVEVLARGEEAVLVALQEWLWQGPPQAEVTDVRIEAVAVEEDLTGFVVR